MFFSCGEREVPRNEDGSVDGKAVFQSNCISCHGENGNANIAGAKDLTNTQLSNQEIKSVISNGSENGKMMPYKSLLSEEEIDALVEHLKELRN